MTKSNKLEASVDQNQAGPWLRASALCLDVNRWLNSDNKLTNTFFSLAFQEGFAPPEDDDLDEQAHLDQDEYWTLRSPSPSHRLLHLSFFFLPSFIFCSARSRNTHHYPCSLSVSSSLSHMYICSQHFPPSTLWPSTYNKQLLYILLLPASTTVMYNISQLLQHEQRRNRVQHGGLLWQTVNFKSVNITDIVISERTMSLLILELFICLWCAVILLLEHRTTLLKCAIRTGLPELLKL